MQPDLPIDIIKIMEWVERSTILRPGTMLLGWTEGGRPIAVNQERETNILIIGRSIYANNHLLRAMLYSLVARTRPGRAGLVVANYQIGVGKGEGDFQPLAHTPHCLRPVADTAEEALSSIRSVEQLILSRIRQGVTSPPVVVAITDVDQLYCKGFAPFLHNLKYILQHGPAVGVHSIITISNPDSPTIQTEILPLNFSVRIAASEEAVSEFDFTAEREDKESVLFRSAFISDFDLYTAVEKMSRRKKVWKLLPSRPVRERVL